MAFLSKNPITRAVRRYATRELAKAVLKSAASAAAVYIAKKMIVEKIGKKKTPIDLGTLEDPKKLKIKDGNKFVWTK